MLKFVKEHGTKIVGISRFTYLFYKHDSKCGTRQRLHGNVRMKKQVTTKHAKNNVQLSINQYIDVMPHQMKGIGNGRQDVYLLILDTWKSI